MDREAGIFADPAKIHRLDHDGRFFRSRGPLHVTPSPQRRPVIIQAGASGRGRDFAAKHAEVIFAIQPFVEGATAYYRDVKRRMVELGRREGDCKILFGVQLFVAETASAAREKQELHNSLVPLEGAVAHLSGALDTDLSGQPLDAVMKPFEATRSQGVVDMYTRVAGRTLTLREMALRHGQSVGFPQLVGTPEQVADQLEDYYERAGGDGFMLTMAYAPGAIEEFVAMVVPELQRRGRLRTDYRGATLRDILHQDELRTWGGSGRPPNPSAMDSFSRSETTKAGDEQVRDLGDGEGDMATIEPTGQILGATVRGVDLAKPLDDATSRPSSWPSAATACCASRISGSRPPRSGTSRSASAGSRPCSPGHHEPGHARGRDPLERRRERPSRSGWPTPGRTGTRTCPTTRPSAS